MNDKHESHLFIYLIFFYSKRGKGKRVVLEGRRLFHSCLSKSNVAFKIIIGFGMKKMENYNKNKQNI